MEQIKQALTALGNTPQEVYICLKAHGIKGRRGSPCQCPVANYLFKMTGKRYSVGHQVAFELNYIDHSERIPQPVAQFILMFDNEKVDSGFEDLLDPFWGCLDKE